MVHVYEFQISQDPFHFVSFSWLIGGTMLPILTADHQW